MTPMYDNYQFGSIMKISITLMFAIISVMFAML
jgi:hypothetical protein